MQPHATRFDFEPGHCLAIAALALSICIAAGTASEAAVFTCSGGDVPCLVAAITTANANGQTNTIRLAQGTYTLTAVDNTTDGPNGLPSVTSTLTITGAGATVTSVERAADAPLFRVVHVASAGVLTLRQMTIRGGRLSDLDGAGVITQGSGVLARGLVNVSDSVITGNVTNGRGGGVAGGTVTVTRSTVSDNRGGGGIYIEGDGSLRVRNSTLERNATKGAIWFRSSGRLMVAGATITENQGLAREGGGLIVDGPGGATVTLTNSTVSNNISGFGGGIIIASDSTVEISHSAVTENVAFEAGGGGIAAGGGGTVTINDSTVGRNESREDGAGLLVIGATRVTVTASTIVGNKSTRPGGIGGGISGSARLENTILALNTTAAPITGPPPLPPPRESNCFSAITSLGHNLIRDPTRCGDLQPTDVVGDPGLGDFIDPGRPGTGHYPLLDGSLAIDAGSDEACSRRDQQGLVRGIDGDGDSVRGCDIGAIEFYPVVNDWVQLDRVHATFVPSDPTQPDPLAAGGRYDIDAAFTNVGGETICRVAFDVTTLDVASGVASVLTRNGALIGREGIQFPATLVGEHANLPAGDRARYRFTIGVTEPAAITFFVNMLGERTAGSCALRDVAAGDSRAVDAEPD